MYADLGRALCSGLWPAPPPPRSPVLLTHVRWVLPLLILCTILNLLIILALFPQFLLVYSKWFHFLRISGTFDFLRAVMRWRRVRVEPQWDVFPACCVLLTHLLDRSIALQNLSWVPPDWVTLPHSRTLKINIRAFSANIPLGAYRVIKRRARSAVSWCVVCEHVSAHDIYLYINRYFLEIICYNWDCFYYIIISYFKIYFIFLTIHELNFFNTCYVT